MTATELKGTIPFLINNPFFMWSQQQLRNLTAVSSQQAV